MAIKVGVGGTPYNAILDDLTALPATLRDSNYTQLQPTLYDNNPSTWDFGYPIWYTDDVSAVNYSYTNESPGEAIVIHLDESTTSRVFDGYTPSSVLWMTDYGFAANGGDWTVIKNCWQASYPADVIRAYAVSYTVPSAPSSTMDSSISLTGWDTSTNSYGTGNNVWADVSISFQHDTANNRIAVTYTYGDSINGSTQTTSYVNYSNLTGISSVQAEYNLGSGSQSTTGENTSSGVYPWGPRPDEDGYNDGTYYTIPTSGVLFWGWQARTYSGDNLATTTSADFSGSDPDIRIKLVCNEGTFYATAEVPAGTITCHTNPGNTPGF